MPDEILALYELDTCISYLIMLLQYFLFCHFTVPEVIKLFSYSTQLCMKFFLLINVKMPTIVGILTFMSGKNSILCLSEPKISRVSWYFMLMSI